MTAPPDRTPATLIQRLQREPSPELWLRFVDLFTPVLRAFAARRHIPPADADDLIQDVFVTVLQQMPTFAYRPDGGFRRWLCTVLLNKHRDRRRAAAGRAAVPVPADLPDPAAGGPDALAEDEYRRLLVRQAVALLHVEFRPDTWRACWEHVALGRPAEAVARELGMSVNAVYVNSSRVVRRLRAELRDLLD